MKRIKILLTYTFAGMISCANMSAYGATRCLPNSNISCESKSEYNGTTNWGASCISGNAKFDVSGVWACSETGTGYYGSWQEWADTLGIRASTIDGKLGNYIGNLIFCWCRMISPAVSQWVTAYSAQSTEDCLSGCSTYCNTFAQMHISDFFKHPSN